MPEISCNSTRVYGSTIRRVDTVNNFSNALINAAIEAIPISKPRKRGKMVPWWSENRTRSTHLKRAAFFDDAGIIQNGWHHPIRKTTRPCQKDGIMGYANLLEKFLWLSWPGTREPTIYFCVFFGIRKILRHVWRRGLLYKLGWLRAHGNMFKLMKSFVSSRTFEARVDWLFPIPSR